MHEDDPANNGPHPPAKVETSNPEEESEPSREVIKAPEGTPIIVNTVSGRELVLKFSEDCYIAATLAKHESTAEVAGALAGLMLGMADMRYGGRKESIVRLKKMWPEVDGG